MSIQSDIITITYAGQAILEPGQHLDATEYGFSRSFSTTAEPLIGAAAPSINAYGNAQGSIQIPVYIDCESEPQAMALALSRTDHAENNQTGTLSLSIGADNPEIGLTSREWKAGIQAIECSISYTPLNTVRLHINYNFLLAEAIG